MLSSNCKRPKASIEDQAAGINQAFKALTTDLGAFTGSFASWADGEEKKNDPEMEQLQKDIVQLQMGIDEYKAKMLKWGLIGGIDTVGITAGLCLFLGPVGLVAGLIGAGATISFMIHWSNEITNRDDQKRIKNKRLQELTSQEDTIIATRAQLVELGSNSFKIFSNEINNLNMVWAWAMNDAVNVMGKLEEIQKDVQDLVIVFVICYCAIVYFTANFSYDDELLREYILPTVGGTTGLYGLMATYLERYADGVTKAEIPKSS